MAEGDAYTTSMTSSYLRGDDLTAPVRIHADRQAGTLRIEWVDGHVSTYDFVRLRWLCPCAAGPGAGMMAPT